MLLTEGQTSDYKGAALMLADLLNAKVMLGDRGYDAARFRDAPAQRGIAACIPSQSNRKAPIPHHPTLYRRRRKIEDMFGRLKDWRRVHTRYDRCAHTFMAAIVIAATVIFWIGPQRVLSLGPPVADPLRPVVKVGPRVAFSPNPEVLTSFGNRRCLVPKQPRPPHAAAHRSPSATPAPRPGRRTTV